MELLQLRYFQTLARTSNITKTAQELAISPPALSASLARLEGELGTTLFDRVGNRIFLNQRGTAFLSYVDFALNALENAVNEVHEMERFKETALTVNTTSPNAWNKLFVDFCARYPEIQFNTNFFRIDQVQASDLQSKYDLLLASPDDVAASNLSSLMLYDDDYPVLLVPLDHPLAARKTIRLVEVKDEPFVSLSSEISSRNYFDRLCRMAGFTPRIAIECNYILRPHMILNHFGVGFSTAAGWKNMLTPGITAVEIVDPVSPRRQALFWDERHYKNPSAALFISFAQEFYHGHDFHTPVAL